LLRLRKWAGLSDTLSKAEVFALQNKEINMDETDPAELVSLATISFLESDGHASIIYFERALKADSLKPFQKLFIRLSLDRLKNPEKYENSIGLLILKLQTGGSFDKAGLKVGDVLLHMDGKTLIDPMDIATEIGVGGKKPYLLKVIRDNQLIKIVFHGGESAQAALTQLVMFNPIQL
jgi:predicted metalloprotease with PDZ domain